VLTIPYVATSSLSMVCFLCVRGGGEAIFCLNCGLLARSGRLVSVQLELGRLNSG
jgi:hypothetical protein